MNDFIELKRKDGKRFLFSPSSCWEIHEDELNESAWWVNHKVGRNIECGNTYREVKQKLGLSDE